MTTITDPQRLLPASPINLTVVQLGWNLDDTEDRFAEERWRALLKAEGERFLRRHPYLAKNLYACFWKANKRKR